jgi:uncharacterized repeat protein (TIGR01451 family)
MLAGVLAVLGFTLLLPGRAAPMHDRASDTVTISMSAPANVLQGNHYDYTITVTYNGEPGGVTADYTVTDALPAQVRFIGVSITNGTCPTTPPSGQNGTVACNFKFAPLTKTVTITITAEASDTGTVMNTAQLSSGGTASATTSVDSAPAGSITVSVTGPDTINLSATTTPARFPYRVVLTYNGPPIRGSVYASFVDRLPDQMSSPGIGLADGLRDQCKGDDPPKRAGGTLSCSVFFTEDRRTRTNEVTVRPTGTPGSATNMVEVSTGATATWTTTVEPPPPDPEPQPSAPAPVAGPAAAPTTTVAESFTRAGTSEPETVTISPKAQTVQVALTWPNSSSSFDATGFTLSSAPRTLAASEKLRATKKRGARWLDVRIKGVHRGKLKFRIVAKRVHGRTRVVAKIRQSKR